MSTQAQQKGCPMTVERLLFNLPSSLNTNGSCRLCGVFPGFHPRESRSREHLLSSYLAYQCRKKKFRIEHFQSNLAIILESPNQSHEKKVHDDQSNTRRKLDYSLE